MSVCFWTGCVRGERSLCGGTVTVGGGDSLVEGGV